MRPSPISADISSSGHPICIECRAWRSSPREITPLPFWSQHAEPSDPGSAGGKQRTGGTGLGNAALGVKRRAVQKPMLKHKATADWQKFLKKGKKKL